MTRERPDLSIVIPSYNEEVTVGGVVRAHSETTAALGIAAEIVVLDDGSTDTTPALLDALRPEVPELEVMRSATNRGIPATMSALYARARGEWIYFTPADGQVPSAALEIMWKAREGMALVVGRRTPRRDPASRVLIAQVYSAWLRIVFGLPVRDIDSVKLYRASDLRRSPPRSESNFFEAEILISLCRQGRPVVEVEIPHRPRIAGRAKGVTFRSAVAAVADLARFSINEYVSRIRHLGSRSRRRRR